MQKNTFLALIGFLLVACNSNNEASVTQTTPTVRHTSTTESQQRPDVSVITRNYTFTVNVPINPIIFPSKGGAPTTCEQHNFYSLPVGLHVDATQDTCVIHGTPMQAQEKKGVIITVINGAGSDFIGVSMAVVEVITSLLPPDTFVVRRNYTFVVGVPIDALVFPNKGGAPSTCEQDTFYSLPTGLHVDATQDTCVIHGTPMQAHKKKGVIIRVINDAGSDFIAVSMAVAQTNVPPLPPDILVTKSDYIFPLDVPIDPIIFRNEGGAPSICEQDEFGYSLPVGLHVDATWDTCVIHGTPTQPQREKGVLFTASNEFGINHPEGFTMTVKSPYPPLLVDKESYIFAVDEPIEEITFRIALNNVASCTSEPQLPTGLHLDSSRNGCAIRGAVQSITPKTQYVITAEHAAGNSSAEITILSQRRETGNLPPDPGEAGKTTLAGIDSDNDGVRDDIQRYIAQEYWYSEKLRRVLTDMVKADQEFLLNADDKPKVLEATAKQDKQISCSSYVNPEGSYQILKAIKAEILNTEERIRAWIKADSHLGGMVFRLPDDRKAQCNFDPDALPN